MASFAPIRGTREELNNTNMVDGQFLFETDQGDGNRIYADVADASGDLTRVQVGGERGEQNRLSFLKDAQITNPKANDYLKYDGTVNKWVNDPNLNKKVANLGLDGKISGENVKYNNTTNIITEVDSKIKKPINPNTEDYLRYDGNNWVSDNGNLKNKTQNLDSNGKISGNNVMYDGNIDIVTKINQKVTTPTGGSSGDALVLGIGGTPRWENVRTTVTDNLSSSSATDALSANQGRQLNQAISDLGDRVDKKVDSPASAGLAGQVLGLDALGNTVWKNVSGGGGGGGDWIDITGKPFDAIYDTSSSANADFEIKEELSPLGQPINMMYLNDETIFRPSDTNTIADDVEPAYLPVSVNKAGGGQEKRRLSFTSLLERIKTKIIDNSTIIKDINGKISVPIDETTIIIDDDNKISVPIDNDTIVVDSSTNEVKVSENITEKLDYSIGTDAWVEDKEYVTDEEAPLEDRTCIYENKIYLCILTHTSSQDILPTDTTYWKVTNIASLSDDMSKVTAKLSQNADYLEKDLANGISYTQGSRFDDSGNVVSDDMAMMSDYVAISGWGCLVYTRTDPNVYPRIIGYDSSKNKISSPLLAKSTDVAIGVKKIEFSMPSNVAYVRYSLPNTANDIKLLNTKSNVEITKELSTLPPKTYSATGINATLTTNRVVKSGHVVTLELEFKLATSTGTATNIASLPFTLPTNIGGLMVCNSDDSFYSIGYMTTNGHVHSLKTLNLNTTYEITGTIIVNE